MRTTAIDPTNSPVKGTLSACSIPPKVASLNPHSAIIRCTKRELFSSFWMTDIRPGLLKLKF